jgi:hypothetical protein
VLCGIRNDHWVAAIAGASGPRRRAETGGRILMSNETAATGISAFAGTLCLHDPAEYEESLVPWELLAEPLACGAFQYHRRHLVTPHLILYTERMAPRPAPAGVDAAGLLRLHHSAQARPGQPLLARRRARGPSAGVDAG